MINTDTYVHTVNQCSWHLFSKCGSLKDSSQPNEQIFYMNYINSNHFKVIIDIEYKTKK